jgi:hypothetical protein
MNLSRDWLIANGVEPSVLDQAIAKIGPAHGGSQDSNRSACVPVR